VKDNSNVQLQDPDTSSPVQRQSPPLPPSPQRRCCCCWRRENRQARASVSAQLNADAANFADVLAQIYDSSSKRQATRTTIRQAAGQSAAVRAVGRSVGWLVGLTGSGRRRADGETTKRGETVERNGDQAYVRHAVRGRGTSSSPKSRLPTLRRRTCGTKRRWLTV
jgi:hypothetical protein